jgi:hypothetical protein
MSEETKKIDQTEQEPKTAELSEQDLDKVAGGTSNLNLSKSNIDTAAAAAATAGAVAPNNIRA